MTSREVEPADEDVVRRIKQGEREAYRLLVDRYQDTLYRYAVSMVGEPEAAADLVQSTFVNAYAKLSRLRDGARYGGWVYRMCGNRCRDHLKSRRRRDVSLDDSPPAALRSAARTDGELEREELRRALDAALTSLNDEHRIAFMLKHVEERSYEEMSQMLGVSVPALKMRVHRAREALKDALEEML